MSRTDYICVLANYNEWMNRNLYEAVTTLPEEEITADKKAFFGSILGTLNHLAIGDTLWLKRFATHPASNESLDWVRKLPTPTSLDQPLCSDIQSLSSYRQSLDKAITVWAQSLAESDLDHVLHYTNSKGLVADKVFFGLIMHFFNHQTHHRGQVTTLLTQTGVDVGVTDLITLMPNETGGQDGTQR